MMKDAYPWLPVFVCVAAITVGAESGIPVTGSVSTRHPDSGIEIVRGACDLPFAGEWQAEAPMEDQPVRRVILVSHASPGLSSLTGRARRLHLEERLHEGRSALARIWGMLYRRELAFRQSQSPDGDSSRIPDPPSPEQLSQHPYGQTYPNSPPYVAILPEVPLRIRHGRPEEAEQLPPRQVLAVELQPLVDDGNHWVLHNDGRVTRLEADAELLARHGLTLRPLVSVSDPVSPPAEADVRCTVYGVRDGPGIAVLPIHERLSGERAMLHWDVSEPRPAQSEIVTQWAVQTSREWSVMASEWDAPVMGHWADIYRTVYGVQKSVDSRNRRRRDRRERTTSVFHVLGGRAAMRETLQMQALTASEEDGAAPRIPLESLPRIDVESHPFAEMLGDAPGGSIGLADLVPPDRFFVHVADPRTLPALLDESAAFLSKAGSAATGRSLDRDLEEHYLSRLGLTRDIVDSLLRSGAITELAVCLPDLFLIDGTHLTVIVRTPNAEVLRTVIGVAGGSGASNRTEVPLAHGGSAFWAFRPNIVVLSTSASERDAIIRLAEADGRGSLGQSAEFRYMLTRLPFTDATRAYIYLSDPFIRRLIGPEVKIGQLRRLVESAGLYRLTSAALLYEYDFGKPPAAIDELVACGYLAAEIAASEDMLGPALTAESPVYGRLSDLRPLLDVPVSTVTPQEADAYSRYAQSYSRYWRRFFDPIAVRIADGPDGALETETYILPLIDNSLYNGLKQVMISDPQHPMRVPRLSPAPVAMLSLQLTDSGWVDFLREFTRDSPNAQMVAKALQDLAYNVHFAVHDSNPVIAFGSGDLPGIGGAMAGSREEVIAIPMLLSLFTRPVTILVELNGTEHVTALLESDALSILPHWRFESDHYRLTGRNAWVYRVTAFGLNIRFRAEIQHGHLVIQNIPWYGPVEIVDIAESAPASGRLFLDPSAAERQRSAMFAAAAEGQRRAAMEGIAYLMPLLLQGTDLGSLEEEHKRLFGFTPVHPQGGMWAVQEGILQSTIFGSLFRQSQPEDPLAGRGFGTLQGVQDMTLTLAFEDTGLRTQIRWTYRPDNRR